MNKGIFRISVLISFLAGSVNSCAVVPRKNSTEIHGVFVGMEKEEFAKVYPKKEARTFRQSGSDEWITFNEPLLGEARDAVTFHIQNGKINGWRLNDQAEIAEEYLGEFCSGAFVRGIPKMYAAIKDVLERIPWDAFLKVTDRRRPVIFTEYYDSGTARFANSAEITVLEDDPLTFTEGMTIMKLGTALDAAPTPAAIEGVVAHELAHRVLEHSRKGNVNCAAEREANRLIKEWGFTKEYEEAKKIFGHQPGEPASCVDK